MANKGKKVDNDTKNLIIVFGTLALVILFMLFASGVIKLPTLTDRKKTTQSSNKSSDKLSGLNYNTGEDGKNSSEKVNAESKFNAKEELIAVEYKKFSDYVALDGMELKIPFHDYLAEYEKTNLTEDEFFKSWYKKYDNDKEAYVKLINENLSESEKEQLRVKKEEIYVQKYNEELEKIGALTEKEVRDLAKNNNLKVEEVDSLIKASKEILNYAIEKKLTIEFSLDIYIYQYKVESKNLIGIDKVSQFNKTNFKFYGIE